MDARFVLLIDILNVYFQNNFPAISQIILSNRGFDINYTDYNSNLVDYVNITAKFLFIEDAQRAFNELQRIRTISHIRLDDIEGEDRNDEPERHIDIPDERDQDYDEKESEDVMRIHNNNLRMLNEREDMFIISFPQEYEDDMPQQITQNENFIRLTINANKVILFYRTYDSARNAYSFLITNSDIPNVIFSYRGIVIRSSENDLIDNTHLFEFGKDAICTIL